MLKEYKVNDMVYSDKHGLGRIVEVDKSIRIEFMDDTIEECEIKRFPYEILDEVMDEVMDALPYEE